VKKNRKSVPFSETTGILLSVLFFPTRNVVPVSAQNRCTAGPPLKTRIFRSLRYQRSGSNCLLHYDGTTPRQQDFRAIASQDGFDRTPRKTNSTAVTPPANIGTGVRTQGQMGSADPPWKMDEK